MAYTQAMKIGRTDDALATIRAYEMRFAQGRVYPERVSMAWLKLRILCKRGLGDACRQASEAYIRLEPDSPRGHLAQGVTAN
jgi:hypothetical protein